VKRSHSAIDPVNYPELLTALVNEHGKKLEEAQRRQMAKSAA
jgi:hypothetical protein